MENDTQSVIDQIKKLMGETRVRASELFGKGCKALFDENPELRSFGFKAYTPYFNDGDTCTYSVHSDEPEINDISGYEIYDDEHKDLKPLQEKVRNFLRAIPSEVVKYIFGDHVEITITPEGVTTETYDHD